MVRNGGNAIPRKTAAEWALIRVAVEHGETFSEVSRKFSCSMNGVRIKAKREGWKVPKWERKGETAKATASESHAPAPKRRTGEFNSPARKPAFQPPEDASTHPDTSISLPSDLLQLLETAADADPETMRAALLKLQQRMLASPESIAALMTIRTVKDYLGLLSSWHKLSGLADKQEGGKGGLLAPMRTVSRRVVEVPPVEPVAGDLGEMDEMDEMEGV